MRCMERGWRTDLPVDISVNVIVPHRFEHFEEPSAHAEKILGYDKGDRCCYYQHAYMMTRDALDDEDNFYEEMSYREMVVAWLLDSGQWLCRKHSRAGMGCNMATTFRYELAESRPR